MQDLLSFFSEKEKGQKRKRKNNMENTTTNGVNLPAPVKEMRETLPALLEKSIPWMEAKHQAADDLLNTIPDVITSDEEAEDVTAKLAAVRSVGTALSERRMEMTKITDAFKDVLMAYERPFDAKSDKSKYNQRRKILEAWQQKKLEERRKQEQEALKRKELENLKVDLRAKILQALNDNLIDTKKRADDYARNLFATLEVENFDTHAEAFKKQKPKLKIETYNKCFEPPVDLQDKTKQFFGSPEAFDMFLTELQKEETYDKWNNLIQEAVAPILNEWRAKIPELKQECIAKSKASEEERLRLEEDRKKRDEEERQKKQKEIDQEAFIKSAQIQEDAQVGKMSNEFAAQATMQNMDEGGAVKLVAKFTDPKLTPKALISVIYHVFASEKFQGIQKRDSKTKKLLFDDKNRPVYIDAIQWWLDQYIKDCNAAVDGLQLFEDSKVTIRK